MIVLETVAIGLVLLASQTCANLCTGKKSGDHLPNLSDCSTFFVCNFGESKLFKCPEGLLYDHSKRSCNWAKAVNCDRNAELIEGSTILPSTEMPTPNTPQTEKPNTSSPQTEAPITISTQSGPVSPTMKPEIIVTPAHPEYNATNVIFPGLVEISPNIFHCMNPEFYFAPHPRHCEKYFICENYRIHPHECGEGVYWDYVNNRCNFPLAGICYAGYPTNTFGKMVCSTSGRTVEYKENECKYVADAGPPLVIPGNEITCLESQAFLPHEDDCRNYYICSERIPIAVTCPEYSAWDENKSQCNEESWKQCIG